jgi:hypothetical protein
MTRGLSVRYRCRGVCGSETRCEFVVETPYGDFPQFGLGKTGNGDYFRFPPCFMHREEVPSWDLVPEPDPATDTKTCPFKPAPTPCAGEQCAAWHAPAGTLRPYCHLIWGQR